MIQCLFVLNTEVHLVLIGTVKSKCHHPDHEPGLHSYTSDCRQASLATCLKIEGFPGGGRYFYKNH